jgi:hypothetical protein
MRREMVDELNGLNINEHDKVAEIIEAGHIAEQQAQKEIDQEFMSPFTGPETDVVVPQVKQELDQNQEVKRRMRLFRRAKRVTVLDRLEKRAKLGEEGFKKFEKGEVRKLVTEFMKAFKDNKGFLPSPREQARMQREKLKPQAVPIDDK